MLNLEKLSSRGHLLPNLETKSRGSELHEEKQLSYVKRELFHCRFCHLISVQTGCRILGGYYMCTFYNILLGLRKVIHSQRSGSYWKPNGYFLSDIHLALYVSNHFTWLVIINFWAFSCCCEVLILDLYSFTNNNPNAIWCRKICKNCMLLIMVVSVNFGTITFCFVIFLMHRFGKSS